MTRSLPVFTPASRYKKIARFIAILWTLLILLGCFTPGEELPEVPVPLIDKWVHILLFSGFSFFWLLGYPAATFRRMALMVLLSLVFGSLIEVAQGIFTFLHRSMEFMDAVADTIGGLTGVLVFWLLSSVPQKSK